MIVAAGAVAKALLKEIGIEVDGVVLVDDLEQRVDQAREARDTIGGASRCAPEACRPGSAPMRRARTRLDARLAAAVMGIQAVKGVEIGGGFALADLRGSEAHDEIHRDEDGLYRETNRAGGIEAGISNGEEIVVRAGMKPLPTLMKPLQSVDLETGEPPRRSSSAATPPRSRRLPSSPRRRSRSSSRGRPWRSSAATRSATSSVRTTPTASGSIGNRARPARRPRRLHGRGQDDLRHRARPPPRTRVRRPRPRAREHAARDDSGDLRQAR